MSLDDTTDKQWRLLASQGKDLEAANLIMAYIKESPTSDPTAYFHAGQEYACAGRSHYSHALRCFRRSYKIGKEAWNAYVDGTLAFLQGDNDALNNAIISLQQIPDQDDLRKVLSKLALGLKAGRSYKESYDS